MNFNQSYFFKSIGCHQEGWEFNLPLMPMSKKTQFPMIVIHSKGYRNERVDFLLVDEGDCNSFFNHFSNSNYTIKMEDLEQETKDKFAAYLKNIQCKTDFQKEQVEKALTLLTLEQSFG